MGKLTRRGLLGASSSILGLAACNRDPLLEPEARITVSPDDRAAYPGTANFIHGVASGDPLPDSVIIWTRVTPDAAYPGTPIPISFGVFEDEALEKPVRYGQYYAMADRDYTVKVNLTDLEPDKVYYFRFVAKVTSGDVSSPTGRTKTAAASGDKPVKFAVISCSNFPFGYFHVYRDIAETPDLDAVIHLGDYLYEYGIDGYGGDVGQTIDRNHEPPLEIITLDDYRTRHAQYKTDPDLQAAHAAAPWLCTWDDHESTNNSYRSGAENHNPEAGEGNWTDRKQAAVQAYLEWMPVRDPEVGKAREALYRRFDFGDVASVMCLETRLTGRSDEISWFTEIGGLEASQVPLAAAGTMVKVQNPERTMLGAAQETWLAEQLKDSTEKNKSWQVLANQIVMARVRPPNFTQTLTDAQKAAQDIGYIQQLIPFSQLGLPFNLDAWDGFPAARDRLYASAEEAGARLVTLTGDTHTAWANTLVDATGERRGVEFGCTSVTSPGLGLYIKEVPDLGQQFVDANPEVDFYDPFGNGWTLVTLTKDEARADYRKITDVTQETYTVSDVAAFASQRDGDSLTALSPA
ncbi:MAG: alkaline phosphatase D family protein [Hyphomonadaceae bacterium]|nr:alkaline phosphatase D family protein [Hyphomonadaceae bacterium]